MAKDFPVKLVHFLGWVLFIFASFLLIVLIIGEGFEFGLIAFCIIAGAFGFFLTRYKRGKKLELKPKPQIIISQPKPTKSRKSQKAPKPDPVQPSEVIETSRKELGIPPGKIFHISYEDYNGNTTERDIEILKIYEKGEKVYIHAFCHLRLEVRLFLIDRIKRMTDDGQQIKDIKKYLLHDFTPPSAEDLAALALEDPE